MPMKLFLLFAAFYTAHGALEAQQELQLEADEIEQATRAFRDALTERIAPNDEAQKQTG